MAELLKTGKVKGYEGHHINNVKDHPGLAGTPIILNLSNVLNILMLMEEISVMKHMESY